MIEDFQDNHFQAIPFVLAVCAIYWFIRRAYQKKKYGGGFKDFRKQSRLNEVIRLVFVAWAVELVCCTLVPTGLFYSIWSNFYNDIRFFTSAPKWFSLNLPDALHVIQHQIPSEKMRQGMFLSLIYGIILNVIMFVPLGFLLPILQKRANLIKVVLTGLSCTLFIEFVQGFMYRDSTIDDVVCNTLGTLLGYLLYLLIKKISPQFVAKARAENINK